MSTIDKLTNELQKDVNKLLPLNKAKYDEYLKILNYYTKDIESLFVVYSLKYVLYQACHNQGFERFDKILHSGYCSILNNTNISQNDKKMYKEIITRWEYKNNE